jgi:hypothetical protein
LRKFSNYSLLQFKFFTNKTANKMNIIPVEALQDNYMYLIVDEASNECACVDPVEPQKVKIFFF